MGEPTQDSTTQTTYRHARPPEGPSPAPRIRAIRTAFPPYRYPQHEIMATLARTTLMNSATGVLMLRKIEANAGVATRHLSLPLGKLVELADLDDFTQTNQVWLQTALDLGEQALTGALSEAGVRPGDVDAVISTTVTGLAVPSLEARLAQRTGLRPDIRRIPLFGNGCAGGAAGLALLRDYLSAHPDQIAVLLAVELCSLAYQQKDGSMANIVAGSLFGDGAAVVVAAGGHRAGERQGPQLVDSASWLVPDSDDALGWAIGSHGFRIRLAPEVPTLTEAHLPQAVHSFLSRHALTTDRIGSWIIHGGGPKVLTAVERALSLAPDATVLTRRSMADRGNLSSVSVLDVLDTAMGSPPPAGTHGLVAAMGPGFAVELVLVRW
ncbi:type III polyketide synthase [Streptomyces sp. NPDC058989]|uniref:type III polyketide synthase n=1 Tax=Streptomyces sp. NPDC058989 TaxID=3346686 RepID=UPI0036A6C880